MDESMILEKEKAIKKEITRLKNIYKNVDERKLATVDGLIQESAFMRITLKELKDDVIRNGAVDEMVQGSYSILRESPFLKSYNSMMQRYITTTEKLLSLLPKEVIVEKDDGFEAFVIER